MSSFIIFQAFSSVKCSSASSSSNFIELNVWVSPVSQSDVCSKTSMDDTLNLNFSRSNLISTTYNLIHDVEQFIRENIADILSILCS